MNPTPASSSPLSFLGSLLGSLRPSRRLGLALPLSLLPALLILLQPAPAIAGADWWTNNLATNNLSNNPSLWVTAATGGTATSPVSGDSWIFANTGDSVLNNNFSNAFTVAGITFNAGTGANTINGNSIDLAGPINNNSSKLQTFGTAFVITGGSKAINMSSGGGNLLFNGVISGTDGLTFGGAGTTTFTAANTYSGMTALLTASNPTLVLSNSLALQNSVLSYTSGVRVQFGTGSTNYTLGGLSAGSLGDFTMTNTAGSALALTLNNNINNSSLYQGRLKGAGATVTKTGAGVQTLSGINTYSGVTRVNGGALNLFSTNSLYGGTNSLWTAANITVASNATIGVGYTNFGSNAVFSLLTTLTNTAGATGLQAGSAFGFDTTGTNLILSRNLGNSANGALGYAVLGTGTLSLTGNNTYTGNTWIYGGTLLYGAGLNSIRASGLSGTLLLTNTTTISNAINVSSVLTQNNGGFNVTNTGLLSGSGTLTATGNGTTTLNPGLGNTSTLGVFIQTGGTLVLTNGTLITTSTANAGNSSFQVNRGTAFINEGTTLISGGGNINSEALIGREGSGTLTMNGGSWTHSGNIAIGYGGPGGGSVLNMGEGTITARTINIGVGNTVTNTLNLNGGVMVVSNVANAGATTLGEINFNGGMIRARTNMTSFIAPAGTIVNNIRTGGLVFDTAGFAVGITNNLLGSNGVADGGLKLTNSTGNGTLTLSGNNTYVGNTTIGTNATLVIGGAGRLGAGNYAGNISTAGTNSALTFSGTAQQNLTGLISGTGIITQSGTGTTTLNPEVDKTNSIGSINISGGTLVASSGRLNITTPGINVGNIPGPGLIIRNGGSFLINGGEVTTTGNGLVNVGGNFIVNSGSYFASGLLLNAYGGTGTITLGGGTITATGGIRPSQSGRGTMNLDGGTLNTSFFDTGGNSPADIFLNGTVINPTAARADFMNANTNILYKVMAGGAKFNLGGFNGTNYNIGIAANLINGYTNTLTDGGLTLTNSSTGIGGGTLTLTGTNSYNGVTTINGGTLAIGAVNAIATNNAVVVNSRGTLQLNASQTLASLTGSGSVTFNNSGLIINVANGSNNIFSGNISGGSTFIALNGNANDFSLSGTEGTLTFSGSNSYTTTLGNVILGGTLVAGSSNAFGSTNNDFLHLAGTLDVGSFNVGVGAVSIGNGTITGSGTLTGRSFTSFNPQNSHMLISASLAGAGATFNHNSTGGTVVLSGSNSFSGVTTVTAGTLVLSNSFALGGSTFDSSGLASGGTLVFGTNSSAFTFGGLQGTDSLALTNELGQALALTVGANNTNTTFSGALTDGGLGGLGGSLTKRGTGTLSLSATNNYTGTTTINGGTLALGTGASLSTNSAIAVNANLAFTGDDNQTQGVTFSTNISGTGTITQRGTGTTTLSPGIGITNTIGKLNVSAGTMNLTNGIIRLSNGTNTAIVTVGSNAILNVNTNGTIINTGSYPVINGTLNVNGGTFSGAAELLVGNDNSGAVVNLNSGQMLVNYLRIGNSANRSNTINLNGGTLQLAGVNFNGSGGSNGVVNFNGSTIRTVNGSQGWGTNFFGTNATYNVLTGGAIFDVAGYTITNNAPLLSGATNDGGVTLMNSSATAASLTMRGVNTYVGNTTIGTNATLVIGGAGSLGSGNYAGNISIAGTNSTFNFASTANQSFTGLISGNGTFLQNGTGTTTLQPGVGNTNTVGSFNQRQGTVVLTNGTLSVTNTTAGAFSIRGDTIINSGATLRTAGSPSIIGGDIPGGAGTLTMNGGSWIQSGFFIAIGYGGPTGVLNMGAGTITAPQIQVGQGGGQSRTLNLNGGVIIVSSLFNTGTDTAGVINFNGGMIRASANQTNFIQAGGTIVNNIRTGGLVFDTAGFAVGITNNLLGSSGVVDGGLSLTNSTGNGTLTLSGSNSYTGGTTINGGTLLANHQLALAGGNVTVNNGSTLLLTNIEHTVGNVTLGNATISGSGTLTGTSYTATNSLNASISESLAGSGTLTMNGAGTLTLSGSNSSYTGGTLLNSGAINITTAKALGNSALTMAGGNLSYNGLNSTSIDNQINVNSATATISNLTGNSANTLTLNGGINLNNNTLTLSGGSFAAKDITGSLGSLGLSSATATLSGDNTYGGTTTLLGGSTLNLGVANGISSLSAVTLGGGSDTTSQTNTLNLSGFNQSLASLNSTSGNSLNQVVNNSATLATLTLTGNSSFAGSLNGNLGLTVSAGLGNVVNMTGTTSSYTGQTLVQSGSLNLGRETTLTATSNVVVANGATLLLSGNNNIHSSAPLTLGGTLSMGGQGDGGTRASAQTFASLTLTANSTIDFSSLSGNSSLTFNTITMNGNELFVFNWSSNVTRLFDNSTSSLSAMDLNNISFFSGGIGSSTFLGKGTFSGTEIVPVPEPGVIMAAALLLGWMLFANRGVLINLISRRRSA